MNKKRTIAITLALLMTASAVAALSVSAAAPTKSTQLSIAVTNSDLVPYQKFTVYGRLMNGTASVSGQTITLMWSANGGLTWNQPRTCVTGYYGGYSYVSSGLWLQSYLTPQQYTIKADFAGNDHYAASSNETTVMVSPYTPNISVYTNVPQPVTRQPFTIYGWVTNPATGKGIPGITVNTEVYVSDYNDLWLVDYYEGKVSTDANGRYVFTAVQLNGGHAYILLATDETWSEYSSNAYYSNNGNNYLTISQANTQLSIFSGTAQPHAGKPFTIYGLLTNAQTKARLPNEGGLTLSYYYGGGWNLLPGSVIPGSVSTNANGQYVFSGVLPNSVPAGTYLIQVDFPGDLNYNPSDSQLWVTVG